jgi:hypothetical protein
MGLLRKRCPYNCGAELGYCRCGTDRGRNPDKQAVKAGVVRGGKRVTPTRKGKGR